MKPKIEKNEGASIQLVLLLGMLFAFLMLSAFVIR
jgi:hypothetical protein